MNVNDPYVLEMINSFIASKRLNKREVLSLVNMVSISSNFNDLKENIQWESTILNIKKT